MRLLYRQDGSDVRTVNSTFKAKIQFCQSSASLSPKCRMIHDGRLSIAELTTLAFASSRGSDRLFLLSSLGADIEGPKQF